MGVTPPSDDDGPDGLDFGIAAVDGTLRRVDLDFPASREEVIRVLGGERVPYDVQGNEVALERVLEDVDRDQFESRQALLDDLHEPFERYRKPHSGRLLGRVRSMLPF